jgi:hypothetical protein
LLYINEQDWFGLVVVAVTAVQLSKERQRKNYAVFFFFFFFFFFFVFSHNSQMESSRTSKQQSKQKLDIIYHNKPTNNLDKYYEYRIYDRNIGYHSEEIMYNSQTCPIVMMSRHQGFQWNDELFVNAYRRSAGYDSHKSTFLENRDKRISSTVDRQQQSSSDNNDVIDIHLTEADCDVWP